VLPELMQTGPKKKKKKKNCNCIAPNVRVTVYNELGNMWKKAVVD
jgi:hypothetical protein